MASLEESILCKGEGTHAAKTHWISKSWVSPNELKMYVAYYAPKQVLLPLVGDST